MSSTPQFEPRHLSSSESSGSPDIAKGGVVLSPVMNHITIETPNMDGYAQAADLLSAKKEIDTLRDGLRHLSQYCEAKSDAMILRKAGDIPSALLRESAADSIFQLLPPELRW